MGLKEVIGRKNSTLKKADFELYDAVYRIRITQPSTSTISFPVYINNSAYNETTQIIRTFDVQRVAMQVSYEQKRQIKYSATQADNVVRLTLGAVSSNDDILNVSDEVDGLMGNESECSTIQTARIKGQFFVNYNDPPSRININPRNYRFGSIGATLDRECQNTCDITIILAVGGNSQEPVIMNETRGSVRRIF